MKKLIILLSIGLIGYCHKIQAQFHGDTQAIYEKANLVLSSEYARQNFPSKIAKLTKETHLPDTITVDDVRLFNFGKAIRSKQGKVEARFIPIILKIINADSEITTEEKALLEAVKNDKNITIFSTQASNKGYALNLTFKAEPDARQLLEDFYENGIEINTLQHMQLHFIDANNINNWLEYYHGNPQQQELATAFMHAKFLNMKLAAADDYKRYMRLFKNFIHGIQIDFSRRDNSVYPNANRNIVLNMIKEFDEAGHIALPEFMYMESMKK